MPLIYCSHCGQSIDADEKLAGMEAACPVCGGSVLVPPRSPQKSTGLKLYPVPLPAKAPEAEPLQRGPEPVALPMPSAPVRALYPAPAPVANPPSSPEVPLPPPMTAPPPLPTMVLAPQTAMMPPVETVMPPPPPFLPPAPPLPPGGGLPPPSAFAEMGGGAPPLPYPLPPPGAGTSGLPPGVPVPYDDYEPQRPRVEEHVEDVDWNKRAGSAAALCWLSAGAYYGVKLYPVLRLPSGWAWGSMGYALAQTTLFLVLCILLGLALGGIWAALGRKAGVSYKAAFGKSMVSVMLLLAVLNIGWQEGLRKALPTAALVPPIAFFYPNAMGGATGNAADGFREAVNRGAAAFKPLLSGRLYPAAEGQTDVEKFRWLANDRLRSLEALLPAYRKLLENHQQNGALEFLSPEWLGARHRYGRFAEDLRGHSSPCGRLPRPLQRGAGVAPVSYCLRGLFSARGKYHAGAKWAKWWEKDTQLFKTAWDAELKVVDATIAWLEYLHAHRDRWTAVDGKLVYSQPAEREMVERLQQESQTAANDAKSAEDSVAATLPQDVSRVEQAFSGRP